MKLADYCSALLGQYGNNMKKISDDSTTMIFNLVKNPNLEVAQSVKGIISNGKFYLINYNYNGNKLWCPIFVIDDRYSPELQKRIIYAINLNYLPPKYRILFFDKLLSMFGDVLEKNKKNYDNGGNVNNEVPMKVSFEIIYKALKTNGDFNYSITGFDYLKIIDADKGSAQIYCISTNESIMGRFLFIDTRFVNNKIMMDAIKDSDIEKDKEKLKEILKSFGEIAEKFSEESKEYYKQLKNLESHYKLFENVK